MNPLHQFRERLGWSQMRAAAEAGVSQAYWSMLERGRRPLTAAVAKRLVRAGLSPGHLPLPDSVKASGNSRLAAELAAFGYEPMRPLRRGAVTNPAAWVAKALQSEELETRLLEAVPWVLFRYSDLDWEWLSRQARLFGYQNQLGYLASLTRAVADRAGDKLVAELWRKREEELEGFRLAKEAPLTRHLTQAESRWLAANRPPGAHFWNVLTDLTAEHLPYAA